MATDWIVDLTALRQEPGSQRELTGRRRFDEPLALDSAGVAAESIDVALMLEMPSDQLMVAGRCTIEWTGPCRRCLEPQRDKVQADLHEVFERRPVEGETWPLDEEQADLEPMIREQVLLNLPVAPLCRDDCQGPDPDRFPATVEADEEPEERPPDPRWAGLDALTFDD